MGALIGSQWTIIINLVNECGTKPSKENIRARRQANMRIPNERYRFARKGELERRDDAVLGRGLHLVAVDPVEVAAAAPKEEVRLGQQRGGRGRLLLLVEQKATLLHKAAEGRVTSACEKGWKVYEETKHKLGHVVILHL